MQNPYLAPAETAPQQDPNAYYGNAGALTPGPGGERAEVSDAAIEPLRQTRPWVMFLSVMAFIGSAFMLFGGILLMVAGAFVPKGGSSGPIATGALGAIYLPMAFLYIYPALKLWSFGSAIGRLTTSRAAVDLEAALRQQKSFWKFAGIVTIVMMVLYFVFFIGMVLVGFAAVRR